MAKKIKKSGAPGKGMKWAGEVSGRIPFPEMEPTNPKRPAKLKPMRTISSGSTASGKPVTQVRNRSKSGL